MLELLYPIREAAVIPSPKAYMADNSDRQNDEFLPIVDQSGIVIGQSARSYVHGGSKLLHPVIHLHIIDRMERIFLQKRSLSKKICPGMWDTAVGGHVSYGEMITEALLRETREEIGLTDFNPVFLDSYIFESPIERELVVVFTTVGSFDFKLEEGEVDGGQYWPISDVEKNLGTSLFTPNFELEFNKYKKSFLALL